MGISRNWDSGWAKARGPCLRALLSVRPARVSATLFTPPWKIVCAAVLAMASGAGSAGNVASASAAHLLPHATATVGPAPYPIGAAPYPVGPAPVMAHHQGGLYRVSGHGCVAYLFGTVHVGASSFYPLAPEVSRALAIASRVVVELDTRANDAFVRAVNKHGSYGPGDDVRRHLAPDTVSQLTAALHAQGVSVSSMARYKPWLLANLLLSMALERDGYRRSAGVESVLLAEAQSRGAPVAELESADYQLGLFDTMNDIESERYLRETLRGLHDGSALRRAHAVVEAWTSGNPQALDALLADATRGGDTVADFTRRVLLGRRNPEMVEHIEQQMRQGSVTFIGVGLLHLLGANGLPQLLAQRGYLVEQVY
jgi:uncharacterized protein YbaP (TraB family)